tara:strand:- start:811 stop:1857 length:1047 start_codon:yes stop_codon:yes gene_type:complete
MNIDQKFVLITGVAGFIGAAVAKRFILEGHKVLGIDNFCDYYDIELKKNRILDIEKELGNKNNLWNFKNLSIENYEELKKVTEKESPDIIINLAAQAGVRYSLSNPMDCIKTNLLGFANILEICRLRKVEHLVYASSSSVYGGNKLSPFKEHHSVDHPVSLYGATKKSNELMAHTYSHNFNIPCTGLRFFTVYGPWGRPDMAPMIFAKAILRGEKIFVNNYGKMSRDFTFIDDIVEGVYKCSLKPATQNKDFDFYNPDPSTSSSPHRVFNIGNEESIELLKFIEIIEKNIGRKANMEFCPLPMGDVISTKSSTKYLEEWIGFRPYTSLEMGIKKFINWYKAYYKHIDI